MISSIVSIKLYSKADCIYCTKAVNIIEKYELMHLVTKETIDDVNERSLLKEKYNVKTFPIVIVNDELIGGYTELHRYIIRTCVMPEDNDF